MRAEEKRYKKQIRPSTILIRVKMQFKGYKEMIINRNEENLERIRWVPLPHDMPASFASFNETCLNVSSGKSQHEMKFYRIKALILHNSLPQNIKLQSPLITLNLLVRV